MGITIAWDDNEQTIVRMTFSEHWANKELRSKGMETILMLRSVNHPVYVISDFRESAMPPVGVLWQARDLNLMRAPNWAAGIMISQDGLFRSLLEMFGLVYLVTRQSSLHIVRNETEAYALIDTLKRDHQER